MQRRSLLKRVFKQELANQLWDYRPLLDPVVPLRDLANLIHDYYYSELDFEDDLYCLAFLSDAEMRQELSEILWDHSCAELKRWAYMVVHFHPASKIYPSLSKDILYNVLYISSLDRCCRVWCWYGNQCTCERPLAQEAFAVRMRPRLEHLSSLLNVPIPYIYISDRVPIPTPTPPPTEAVKQEQYLKKAQEEEKKKVVDDIMTFYEQEGILRYGNRKGPDFPRIDRTIAQRLVREQQLTSLNTFLASS